MSNQLSSVLWIYFKRDLIMAFRRRSEIFNPVFFFILTVSIFPLGIGPSPEILQRVAPGVIWVSALFATLLSLERLFRSDFEDGAIEQLLLSKHPTSLLVLAKVVAHWLITGVPLLLMIPVMAILFQLSTETLIGMLVSLAIGTPILSLIGSIGVALTVGLNRGGILLSLLVLPLYTPVLIFGSGLIDAATSHLDYTGLAALMAAMLLLSLTLVPFATASSLRMSVN
ncbi:MAG: heme exporter protein CcmB [Methylococcales bacterium]|jgi:heme exporter protein B|nr:heme exporter protein CcmB [Methylococcales bacterium]MBT7408630.1 heme exporter protein CcmB [Methylococcales bacterium]